MPHTSSQTPPSSAGPAVAPTATAITPDTAADTAPDAAAVVVVVAHPQMEHSRLNRRLMRSARDAPARPDGRAVQVRDLYDLYPDYAIDVAAEQDALRAAELIVWQHPIQWYSMPALMKLWVDDVLAFGWAYGPGGTALRGKDLWLVVSTGGPEESYHAAGFNRHAFEAFLPAYAQTAELCGMRFLPPLVFHGAHRAGEAALRAHATRYVRLLQDYPHWSGLAELPFGWVTPVPADARPEKARTDPPRAAPKVRPA
jgi:glutathione-regulated potassium-efflux system ancillary protein KefF